MKRLLLCLAVLLCVSTARADQIFFNSPYGSGWYQRSPGNNYGFGMTPWGAISTQRVGHSTFITITPTYYPPLRPYPYQYQRNFWFGW